MELSAVTLFSVMVWKRAKGQFVFLLEVLVMYVHSRNLVT